MRLEKRLSDKEVTLMIKFMGKIKSKLGQMFKAEASDKAVLSGLDIDIDHLYDDPNVAVEVQNRYSENIKRIEVIKPKYRQYVDYVAILERIEMLPPKVKSSIEKLCQIHSETLVQKSEFRDQIQQTEQTKTEYLEQYEGHMQDIIQMMKGHEENQGLVKRDLAYLEAEKSELIYHKDRYTGAYGFIKSAFIGVASISALAALILSTLYFVYNKQILLPALVIMVAVIVATVWVYVFRRYLVYEINKNQKLIKRAIEITNKTKIKYINNQKVLDYQYKKYKVDSSEMLELRYENYRAKISAKSQYRNISNSIAAMMSDIEDALEANGIDDKGLVLDHLDYFVSKQGRKMLMSKLVERRNHLKEEYERTEKENNVINLVLTNYKSQVLR